MPLTSNVAYLSTAISMLVLWMLSILIEKILGLERVIYSVSTLKLTNEKVYNSNRRLSRSVTSNGQYRMKTRGAPHIARGISMFVTLIILISGMFIIPNWFIDHFIKFEEESNQSPYFQICVGIIFSDYMYDLIIMEEYSKLNKPIIAHHGFSIIACILIQSGHYMAIASWYGICMAILGPMVCRICQAFRYEYSAQYPEMARKICAFTCFWYTACMIINYVGQSFIIIYGGFMLRKITYYEIFLSVAAFIGWGYLDIETAKALQTWKVQKYEDVNWKIAECVQIKPVELIEEHIIKSVPVVPA